MENTEKKKEEKEISRTFLLNKVISAESVESVVNGIIAINDEDDKAYRTRAYRKPIKLIVDSYGGSIYCGLALVNVMRNSETPIHTYCYGKSMSMGLYIYSQGDERFASEDASFMYHGASTTVGGTVEDIKLYANQLDKMVARMDKRIVERTKIPMELLNKYRESRNDWYMFGDEAHELGLVDVILK